MAKIKSKNINGSSINKYEKAVSNNYTLVEQAMKGIESNMVQEVTELYGIRNEQMAGMLNISSKTLSRYMVSEKKLDSISSELLLKLVALFNHGTEIFGNVESFHSWLEKPAVGLGDKVPFNYLYTSGGIDLVDEEITRIEYGDLA